MSAIRRAEKKRRITAVWLIICILFQMMGSYLTFPGQVWAASDAVPKKIVRVTEDEIREALENYDGSFFLSEEYIPFDAVYRQDARELVLEKLKGSVLVRQEKLGGGNCTAVVAVKLQDDEESTEQENELDVEQETELDAEQETELGAEQETELDAEQETELDAEQETELDAEQKIELDTEQKIEQETEQDEADSLVENVFMIGMNGGTRACEFVLEIVTDGGIVVRKLYVDEYTGIAGGPGFDTAADPDASDQIASPSDALATPSDITEGGMLATPSDGTSTVEMLATPSNRSVVEAGLATPSDSDAGRSEVKTASASNAEKKDADDDEDSDEDDEEDDDAVDESIDLIDDLDEVYATPSDAEELEDMDVPYSTFQETRTMVLAGDELAGLVKQKEEKKGIARFLARLFSGDEDGNEIESQDVEAGDSDEDLDAGYGQNDGGDAPTFRVAANGIVVLKTSSQGRTAEEEYVPAEAKFTVTFPAGTAFIAQDGTEILRIEEKITGTVFSDGKAMDLELGNSTGDQPQTVSLRLKQYGPESVDEEGHTVWTEDAYADHKKLIDGHMDWHTGLTGHTGHQSTNDVQFWRLWAVDENGGEVEVILPSKGAAKVVVDYLDDGSGNYPGALRGERGTRRTCVMHMNELDVEVPDRTEFVNSDEYSLRIPTEVGELIKNDDHYEKLAYYIDADDRGNSCWGNLTALCCAKVTPAYMQSLSVDGVEDGTEAFDATPSNAEAEEPGNDSGSSNRRVRSFDRITYKLKLTSASRTSEGNMETYISVVEAELDMDIIKARFDSNLLTTVFTGTEFPWKVEYMDKDNNILYVDTPDGLFRWNSETGKIGDSVTLNQIAGTSGDGYGTNVVRQRLVAYKEMVSSGGNAVPGNETINVYLNIGAAVEGDWVEPKFTAYVMGNKDNYDTEEEGQSNKLSVPCEDNRVNIDKDDEKTGDKAVMVTSAPRYNLIIKRNADASHIGWFNFKTGEAGSKDDGESVYGRMYGYGITLQLFNETNDLIKDKNGNSVPNGSTLASKGIRGMELPVGDITFDLSLTGAPGKDKPIDGGTDYSAFLWDYRANLTENKNQKGEWERNMYWKDALVFTYAKGAAPYNQSDEKGTSVSRCYNGGTWSMVASGEEGVGPDGKTIGISYQGGTDITYTFTVNGFDFDFDNWHSPTQSAGNAGDVDWLKESYMNNFSAGYIQVLQRHPAEVAEDASPEVIAELKNTKMTFAGGQPHLSEAEAVTDEIGGTNDNRATVNQVVYTPGGLSKHNSFTRRTVNNNTENSTGIGSGFLGTKYWDGPHFDANAFAGQEIYLWGGAQLARNSDAIVSAYNLLQKFDSSVLSIDTDVPEPVKYIDVNNDTAWPAEDWSNNKNLNWNGDLLPAAGVPTILYAADPLYPDGWSSNNAEQMRRMNAATEEDLIYFASLEELEDAGYTCIAVLLEVREAEIPAGCYPGVRIAMKVSTDNEYIGKTVCTVNTARMWVRRKDETGDLLGKNGEITWLNGNMNDLPKDEASTFTVNQIVDEYDKDLYTGYWDQKKRCQATPSKKAFRPLTE